jgi:hypothetical protein
MRRGNQFRSYQCHRHKDQQPEHGIIAEFLEEWVHLHQLALIRWAAVAQPQMQTFGSDTYLSQVKTVFAS